MQCNTLISSFICLYFQGVNAIHLTDLDGITQSAEDSKLFQYFGNDQIEQTMCVEPVPQLIDNSVLMDNNVRIVDDTVQILGDGVQIVDNYLQVIDTSGKVFDKNIQIVNSTGHIIDGNAHVINEKRNVVDSNYQILNVGQTFNKQLLQTNQKKTKFATVANNNVKMDVETSDVDCKEVINVLYEVVYPEQLNLKVLYYFYHLYI